MLSYRDGLPPFHVPFSGKLSLSLPHSQLIAAQLCACCRWSCQGVLAAPHSGLSAPESGCSGMCQHLGHICHCGACVQHGRRLADSCQEPAGHTDHVTHAHHQGRSDCKPVSVEPRSQQALEGSCCATATDVSLQVSEAWWQQAPSRPGYDWLRRFR